MLDWNKRLTREFSELKGPLTLTQIHIDRNRLTTADITRRHDELYAAMPAQSRKLFDRFVEIRTLTGLPDHIANNDRETFGDDKANVDYMREWRKLNMLEHFLNAPFLQNRQPAEAYQREVDHMLLMLDRHVQRHPENRNPVLDKILEQSSKRLGELRVQTQSRNWSF